MSKSSSKSASKLDEREILFTGPLYKCGGNVKSWKKRTMVLTNHHQIVYFKDLDKAPQGKIFLDEGYMTFREGKPDDCHWPRGVDLSRTIVLITSRRTFYLYGENLAIVDKWREQLNREYKRLKAEVDQQVEGIDSSQVYENGIDKDDIGVRSDSDGDELSGEKVTSNENLPTSNPELESTMTTVGLYATLTHEPNSPLPTTQQESFDLDLKSSPSNKPGGIQESQELYIEAGPKSQPHPHSLTVQRSKPSIPLPPTPLESEMSSELYEPLEEQHQVLYESLTFAGQMARGEAMVTQDKTTVPTSPSSPGPPLPPRPPKFPSSQMASTPSLGIIQTPPVDFEPGENAEEFYAEMDNNVDSDMRPPGVRGEQEKKAIVSLPLAKGVLPKSGHGPPNHVEENMENSATYEPMTSPVQDHTVDVIAEMYDLPSDALKEYSESCLNTVYTDMQPCVQDFRPASTSSTESIEADTTHRTSADRFATNEDENSPKCKNLPTMAHDRQVTETEDDIYDDTTCLPVEVTNVIGEKRTLSESGGYRTVARVEEPEPSPSRPVLENQKVCKDTEKTVTVSGDNVTCNRGGERIVVGDINPISGEGECNVTKKRTLTESAGYKTIVIERITDPSVLAAISAEDPTLEEQSDDSQTATNGSHVSEVTSSMPVDPQTPKISPRTPREGKQDTSLVTTIQDDGPVPVPKPRSKNASSLKYEKTKTQPTVVVGAQETDALRRNSDTVISGEEEMSKVLESQSLPLEREQNEEKETTLSVTGGSTAGENKSLILSGTPVTADDHPYENFPITNGSTGTKSAGSPTSTSGTDSPSATVTTIAATTPTTNVTACTRSTGNTSPEGPEINSLSRQQTAESTDSPTMDSFMFSDDMDSPRPRFRKRGDDMFKKRREIFLQEKSTTVNGGVHRGTFSTTVGSPAAQFLLIEQEKQLLQEERSKLEQDWRKLEQEQRNFELEREKQLFQEEKLKLEQEWRKLEQERCSFELERESFLKERKKLEGEES